MVAALVAITVAIATIFFMRLLGTKIMSASETGISAVLPCRMAFSCTGSSCHPVGVRRSILVRPTEAERVGPAAAAITRKTVAAPA